MQNPLKRFTNLFKRKPKKTKEEQEVQALAKVQRTNEIGTWKYTEEERLIAVKMLGQFMTPMEVKNAMRLNYGVEMKETQIARYGRSEKWKPIIKKLKDEYLANIQDVAGAHKRVRLDRAERLYDKSVRKGNIREALATIEHQRKEMEEKAGVNFNLTLNQYNSMSDDELEERRKQLVEFIKKQEAINVEPTKE